VTVTTPTSNTASAAAASTPTGTGGGSGSGSSSAASSGAPSPVGSKSFSRVSSIPTTAGMSSNPNQRNAMMRQQSVDVKCKSYILTHAKRERGSTRMRCNFLLTILLLRLTKFRVALSCIVLHCIVLYCFLSVSFT
jgi:hypothetical protein